MTSIFICLFFLKKYLLPWLSTSARNSADWSLIFGAESNMFSFSYWLALISKIKCSLRKSLVSLLILEHNPQDNSLKEEKLIWLILEIPGCDQTALCFWCGGAKPQIREGGRVRKRLKLHNPLQGYFQYPKDPTRPCLPNVPQPPRGTRLWTGSFHIWILLEPRPKPQKKVTFPTFFSSYFFLPLIFSLGT